MRSTSSKTMPLVVLPGPTATSRNSGSLFDGNGSSSSFVVDDNFKAPIVTPIDDESAPAAAAAAPKQQKAKKSKSVRFGDFDEVFEIRHFKDMSPKEIGNIYLSSKEMKAIQARCLKNVQRLEVGEKIACPRGLDNHTEGHQLAIDQSRKEVFAAVMHVQDLEDQNGYYMPHVMRDACLATSQRCAEYAAYIGRKDAKVARAVHRKR